MSTSIVYVQFFYNNTTAERSNQFEIGYMTNPTLNVNKVFRYQAEKCLKDKFHQSNMKGIKMLHDLLAIKNKRIYQLVSFYEYHGLYYIQYRE